MQWLNEPPEWSVQGDTVAMRSAPETDFWRVTAQDVVKENGHFYYERRTGDFQVDVRVGGESTGLWDQAGLMIRVNEAHWMKCSREFFDGRQHACVVVTHEFSDWSIVPLAVDPEWLWLRISRQGTTVAISYALDGKDYRLMRLAYLAPVEGVDVGLLCASPEGPGFVARYEGFVVRDLG
jgi:uncharacterized protein